MSSFHTSPVSRLFLGAPIALALSLSWGCARTAPAHEPTAEADIVAGDRSAQRVSPPPVVNEPPAPATPAAPVAQAPQPAPRAPRVGPQPRDPALATPEVVGRVDKGDLSGMLAVTPPAEIEQREIDLMFSASQPKLQSCFRNARAAKGSEVILGFIISSDGSVSSVWPIATEAKVSVTQCVLKTVNAFQFRATGNGTTQATTTIHYDE